ncbi:unnamed protein product [Nyctereutes procyonoides]|uniref:(raccoon dog) hypothetical protein n=1 Tax=Nyctereutes procyonoides TaxID=34880 RepID=A0A811ZH41_NYCPR|nr:unnamed protein product [Nyctereutes procyonoides]
MWGHVNTDRTPALLRTCTLASGHMGLRPADYDSGTRGAMSALTGARLPQDPLEDSGGAVGGHVHIRRDSSEAQGMPSRVSMGPVTVEAHGPSGLSAMRRLDATPSAHLSRLKAHLLPPLVLFQKHCQETWRGDKWLTMLRKWGHYHHSEFGLTPGSPYLPRADPRYPLPTPSKADPWEYPPSLPRADAPCHLPTWADPWCPFPTQG